MCETRSVSAYQIVVVSFTPTKRETSYLPKHSPLGNSPRALVLGTWNQWSNFHSQSNDLGDEERVESCWRVRDVEASRRASNCKRFFTWNLPQGM